MLPMGMALGAIAVDEGTMFVPLGGWGVAGLGASSVGALWGAWALEGLEHSREPTNFRPRALELLGALTAAHWLPLWLVVTWPAWADHLRVERLLASLGAAIWLVLGVAAWSYGRAGRSVATHG